MIRKTFFSREALISIPWILLGKFFTFFLYFVISIVIVRNVTPTEWGVYSLSVSISEYLTIVCGLGLNFSLLRYIPELMTQNNLAGLKRLLTRSAFIQTFSVGAVIFFFYMFQHHITDLLNLPTAFYWLGVGLLVGMLLFKEYLNNTLTALYQSKVLSLFSVTQATVFLSILLIYSSSLTSHSTLWIYSLSILIVTSFSCSFLFYTIYKKQMRSPPSGIGRKRVVYLALPFVISMMVNKLLEQYSEIFFLGYFFQPDTVGYYALGINLAHFGIAFIPLSLNSLFISAFSEAYTKNPNSLSNLIKGLYQLLILFCLPIACYGIIASPQLVTWIYGEKMAHAGFIAAFFFGFKLLPLIWIPLSIAITTKEKIAKTLWLDALPLLINLPLDFFLIKHYGTTGACLAVLLTFITTLPIKLYFLRRIIGALAFPLSFFFRLLISAALLAAVFHLLIQSFPAWSLLPLALIYVLLFTLSIRWFRIIRFDDIANFQSVNIPSLNRIIEFFVSTP